jgi:hypothetical protein
VLHKGLHELRRGQGEGVSPLAVRILAANELLHALDHSARHFPEDAQQDMENGPYWQRQRELNQNLNTLSLLLPERLNFTRNPHSLDAILVQMSTNMAIVQLQRTALGVMYRYSLPAGLIAESQVRLAIAADGIVGVFRSMGEGISAAFRNPLLSFAAYMAASVVLEDLQTATDHHRTHQNMQNLDFLIRMLVVFGRTSPLTKSIVVQLATDMKQTGYDPSMVDKVRPVPLNVFSVKGLMRSREDIQRICDLARIQLWDGTAGF